MCIIKILIDKGVRAWPQYRRAHACMYSDPHDDWRSSRNERPEEKERSQQLLLIGDICYQWRSSTKRAMDAWRNLQPAPPTLSCICVDFIFITGLLSESLVQPSPLSKTVLIQSEKGGWKNHSGPSHPAHSLCVTVWSTLQSSEHQNYQTQEQYEMCQHHESCGKKYIY